jgi:asparagine synthase (glutamine-hydrolysing)
MTSVGFTVVADGVDVRMQTFADRPEVAARMISTAQRGSMSWLLLGRVYYMSHIDVSSDAALVAALYEAGGLSALEKLEGDFVAAGFDESTRRIFALRSPCGIYPLFWLQSGGTIALSTSIRALIDYLPDARLDDEYIADYLSWPLASLSEVPRERTAYRDVQRLLPGWSLEANAATGVVRRREYWDWSAHVEPNAADSIEEAAELLRDRLRNAIRERLSRSGRTASHFSGGMDSTGIALLAEPLLARRGEQLEALTRVYRKDLVLAQELEYIECALVGPLALRHHPIPSDDFLAWDDHDAVPPLDEPSTGVTYVRQARVLADVARDAGADTILGGHGADHLFAVPRSILAAELMRKGRVVHAIRLIQNYAAATANSSWTMLAGAFRFLLPRRREVPPWFTRDYARRYRLATRDDDETMGFLRGRRFRAGDMRSMSGDWINWNIGAPRGILITHPFFDTRVISLAVGFPSRFHEPARPMKPVLAAALTGVLPEKIIHRSRKAHFGIVTSGYVRHRDWLEALVRDTPAEGIDRTVLAEMVNRAALGLGGDALSIGRLEITLTFLKWLSERRAWLEGSPVLPPASRAGAGGPWSPA